jgi:hypothetical protein
MSTEKLANLKKSVEKYFYDNLVNVEGFTVDWEDGEFSSQGLNEWLQPRLLERIETHFHRQTDSAGSLGATWETLLNINIFVRQQAGTTMNTARTREIRDILFGYFEPVKTLISLKDYETGGYPEVGKIVVWEIDSDRSLGEVEPGLLQYNFTPALRWLAEW